MIVAEIQPRNLRVLRLPARGYVRTVVGGKWPPFSNGRKVQATPFALASLAQFRPTVQAMSVVAV
jgi:hypothetical protein